MSQARPLTILQDGSPLFPVEWSPQPVDKPGYKPQQARFPSDGHGRPKVGTSKTETTARAQGREAPRRRSGGDVGAILAPGGMLGLGSDQAPPIRGSESAIQPAKTTPIVTANRSAPRNVGQYSTPPPNEDENSQRTLRFTRLAMARKILRGTPLASCMMHARDAGAGIQVVSYDGCAGYRGWEHCGSRLCPWCCAKLAQEDTAKAERFIRGWVKRKNAIALCHYTLRHTADELPQDVWNAQTKVLNSLHSGQPWERFKEKFGLLEHVYGNEVTDGQNGCHRHQHRAWEVQMCEELHGRTERRRFGRRMEAGYKDLYLRALAKHGRSALPQFALKVSIAAPTMSNAAKAAEYVAKFSKETQQGGLKSGHQGNHTVFELLDIAGDKSVSQPERARARARYADLYFGLKGKHWSYFSEASTADPEPVGGEEEVPEVALDDDGDVLLTLSAREAAMLSDQNMQVHLLELVERLGSEAAAAWLRDFTDSLHWSKQFLDRFR